MQGSAPLLRALSRSEVAARSRLPGIVQGRWGLGELEGKLAGALYVWARQRCLRLGLLAARRNFCHLTN